MKRNLSIRKIFLFAVLSIALWSCSKDREDTLSPASSDALDLIRQSLSYNSGGFIRQVEEAASIAAHSQIPCNASADTTLQESGTTLSLTRFSYDLIMRRYLACNNGVPHQFSFPVQGQHQFESLRIIDESSVNAANIISGLEQANNDWLVDTRYARNGAVISKARNITFNSNILITSGDLTINKNSRRIVRGTALVELRFEQAGQALASYTANVEFRGNNQAVIHFENHTYTIKW